MLLAQAEGRLGIADKFAAVITDPRNPLLVVHALATMIPRPHAGHRLRP